ncbi:MAG: helix-turn-helix domain-containing protein [Candidatus Helarchaeota archaeon]
MKRLEIENEEFTKDELLDLFHKEKNPAVKERILAIVFMMEYKNCSKVAELIGRSRNTVQNWVNDYNAKSLEGLKPAPRSGRPARLTKRELELLKMDLVRNPRELGYDFSNWDGKSVMYHIHQTFGVKFSVRRV